MRIRVVIVEDHALVREGIRRIVEASDDAVVVGEAENGAEAVRAVARLKPDVVLMDVSLPVLSGIEATRRIKASLPSTAVIVLTAYDDEGYVSASLGAGAAGYLLKTARSEELNRAITVVHAGGRVLPSGTGIRRQQPLRPLPGPEPGSWRSSSLTDREWEVLGLAATGLTNKAIASRLGLSSRTVDNYLARTFAKLGVSTRTEAVFTCLQRGWLPLQRPA